MKAALRILLAAAGVLGAPEFNSGIPSGLPVVDRPGSPVARKKNAMARRYGIVFSYQNGPGWTAAHVKRMAAKRRNQQRNKRAHKGR